MEENGTDLESAALKYPTAGVQVDLEAEDSAC